jgi:hypothetical protein
MQATPVGPTPGALLLGYGGLVPFVGLAAALWALPPSAAALVQLALLGYGATIVSFLGAIHWGLAMREAPNPPLPLLVWGVAPSLLGWAALVLGQAPGLLLMTAVLCLCWAVDRALYPRYQLQGWLPMRLQLTLIAGISCLVAAAALAR